MLTPYEDALELLLENTEPLPTEKIFLWNTLDRVLAEDIKADTDKPPFDNSAMDGYAVRSEDISEVPARLRLVGEAPAGGDADIRVEKGTAVRIFTGAPIPEGA
ncbi:MAG: molybdopterin molybdenumtransferase MoeA, partial [Aquificota bacterium]